MDSHEVTKAIKQARPKLSLVSPLVSKIILGFIVMNILFGISLMAKLGYITNGLVIAPNEFVFQLWGGVTNFRFTVDGVAAGNGSKVNWGVEAPFTTAAITLMDILTIATAGAHTIRVQLLQGAATLRIINSEGQGQIAVVTQ